MTFDSNASNLWGSLESLISNRSFFRKDALVCSWLRVRGVWSSWDGNVQGLLSSNFSPRRQNKFALIAAAVEREQALNVSIPRRPDGSSAFWKDSLLHCGRQWTPRARSHEHTSASFRKKLGFEISDSNDPQRFEALESIVTEIRGQMIELMSMMHQLTHLPLYFCDVRLQRLKSLGVVGITHLEPKLLPEERTSVFVASGSRRPLPSAVCSKESFQKADEQSSLLGMETFKACSRATSSLVDRTSLLLLLLLLNESRP